MSSRTCSTGPRARARPARRTPGPGTGRARPTRTAWPRRGVRITTTTNMNMTTTTGTTTIRVATIKVRMIDGVGERRRGSGPGRLQGETPGVGTRPAARRCFVAPALLPSLAALDVEVRLIRATGRHDELLFTQRVPLRWDRV